MNITLFSPLFNLNYNFFLELHIDNVMQTNKAPSAEDKVLEELPQDPPTETLQIIEKNQETIETEKTVAINEHQVCNKSATCYLSFRAIATLLLSFRSLYYNNNK